MKFLVIADLHLDLWNKSGRAPFSEVEQHISELDMLVLAGDLTNKPKIRWNPAFQKLSKLLAPEKIHVFPGNHDFYYFRIDQEEQLDNLATSSGVRYVNCKEIRTDGLRILCATLWTDFELGGDRIWNEAFITTIMNDYRYIRVAQDGFRALTPRDPIELHQQQLQWLDKKLRENFDGKTLVATHHAPHPAVLRSHSAGVEAAYASDLEAFINEHQPDAWLFGHCHDAVDISIGSTRIENVSLGYPHEVAKPGQRIMSLIRSV